MSGMSESPVPKRGKVFLVGAGPGDPGLITLRGVECLSRADVVLFDYLANSQLLSHAPATAERICLGRHGKSRIWSQEEINARLVALAREGKTVVRLKGGDPAIFARGAEEALELARQGIEFEIVPGITAALAAGSCAGIPVTHRELASAVALVTGHEESGKEWSNLDYEALAKFPGTLVFYMGVTTAQSWTAALISHGKPASTPCAIVRRCSFPDQEKWTCTLGDVASLLGSHGKIRPPVIVIVGEVTTLAPTLSWFEKRPLFGQKVIVTRPREQAAALCDPLAELGAEVLVQPAIEIGPPADWSPVDAALARLSEFDWLVFSSANGVRFLLERLLSMGQDLRALGSVKLAAIGPGTAEELAAYRLRADIVPFDEYRAESLAAALAGRAPGKRFLLARASRGREVLAEDLTAAGGIVEQVVVYSSRDVATANEDIAKQLAEGKIDWLTVTSSAIAHSLANLFGESLGKTRLVSISPVTSATLRELGFAPVAEATEYTMSGVVRAIIEQSDALR
jgi:uroporphyrinogen III methyltransferase/synthase